MKNNRLLQKAISLLLCLFIVFSLVFIVVEGSHTCCDQKCRTCRVLQVCRALLNTLGYVLVLTGLLRLGAEAVWFAFRKSATCRCAPTLVSLKVKLLN